MKQTLAELITSLEPEAAAKLTERLHAVSAKIEVSPDQLLFDFINDCLSAHEEDFNADNPPTEEVA